MTTRIMVINHTSAVLEMFNDVLSNEGYQVFLRRFGANDLQAVERIMPDLLILDYVAGWDKSGWHLLQALHQTAATCSIPVIICTTDIQISSEIKDYLRKTGVSLVKKPFDIDDLLAVIEKCLRRRPTIENIDGQPGVVL